MSEQKARRRGAVLRRQSGGIGLRTIGTATAVAGLVAALSSLALVSPAVAQYGYGYGYADPGPPPMPPRNASRSRHKAAQKDETSKEHVGREPFGNMPKGPLMIIVSYNQQKLHLYSNGVHVEDEPVATGVAEHPTPMGVFSVIQRDRYHHSNIYSNAPMPFMERITWSGVALHEGVSLGHPASHGCVRMPGEFAARLWTLKTMGMRVIIARPELKPADIADAHLFVHKDKPPEQIAAAPVPPPTEPVKTAQSVDDNKATDAGTPDQAPAVKPAEIGLRTGNDVAAVATGAAADPAKPEASPPAQPEQKADATPPAADPPALPKSEAATPAIVTAPDASAPVPAPKPPDIVGNFPPKKMPIAIFISRKERKIYVRQNFEPLFDSPITVDHPEQPLGTHVFTALDYLGDDHTAFRWNVVSLPGERPKPARHAENEQRYDRHGRRMDDASEKQPADQPPPQSPDEALARIAIPQNVVDFISTLMLPGSSLVVSDQGLGDETGEGTDFIVVQR